MPVYRDKLHFDSFEEAIKVYPLLRQTESYHKHYARAKLNMGRKTSLFTWGRKVQRYASLPNPIAPNQADILPWVLWDRTVAAVGATTATQITFFNVPIGQGGKSKVDTNLEQVSRLPDPQWFNVTHMGFYFTSNMLKRDIDSMLNAYWHEFWIGQKSYAEGPLQAFPSGWGLSGGTTFSSTQEFSNGWPMLGNAYDLRLPAGMHLGTDSSTGTAIITDGVVGQTILQGQNFFDKIFSQAGLANTAGVTMASSASAVGGTGLNLMCVLFGILSRGVQ